MNVFEIFTGRVIGAVRRIAVDRDAAAAASGRIAVEPPREAGHGELSTNAAMVLAKPLGANPRELAGRLAAVLAEDPDVARADVAGPGFINLTLRPYYWRSFLAGMIRLGPDFGRSDVGRGEAVNVEYVSANPTGPMHVGHCRGAVVGDVLANLLDAAGYNVSREYYINDAGAQVDVLARSAFLRYREVLGEEIGPIPEGLYPGGYLIPVGRLLAERYGPSLRDRPEPEWLPIVRTVAVEAMMALIREDLAALRISHEVFFSERSLYLPEAGGQSRIAEAIALLEKQGLLYRGTLPPPKGKLLDDWEPRELLLFRASQYGDDVDRPILKSDGTPAYVTPDIAYHWDKFRRGFTSMVVVLGADHAGYVKRLKAAVAAVSGGQASIDVLLCQLVRLLRGGEPVKMSKRSGDFVTLREVVDEVGPDAVRFMMVFRKSDAPLDFDFQKVTEQSKDNPVFYVQYAHARTHSVFRQATTADGDLGAEFRSDLASGRVTTDYLASLADSGEIGLVRRIADYPRVLESAARAHEPHRVAFYLYELAAEFHVQWNRGKDLPQLRFVNQAEPELTRARLGLVHAVGIVLASGLALLGVRAPEEMR